VQNARAPMLKPSLKPPIDHPIVQLERYQRFIFCLWYTIYDCRLRCKAIAFRCRALTG
jgi:hypothetical protein